MIKKILTGSAEFFPDTAKDKDYIVFREQPETFKHIREGGECLFSYRPMTKAEYFAWHENENAWYLNFAPLITKEFLDHMDIDIFEADHDAVYAVFKKAFNFIYRNVDVGRWNKYIYRIFIYTCFIGNGKTKLSSKQLATALELKNRVYRDIATIEGIYQFFDAPETEITQHMDNTSLNT